MKRVTTVLLGLGLATAGGCKPIDVPVAQAGQTIEGGAEAQCSDNSECQSVAYCSKQSGGDTTGICELRPLSCPDTYQAVCGYDGVIYWNDCLRMRDGVPSSTAGPCTGEISFHGCGGRTDAGCPVVDAYCNKLVAGPGNDCELPPSGVCWVLPDECPVDAEPARWASCGHPPATCVSLCDAIRAERPYRMNPTRCE